MMKQSVLAPGGVWPRVCMCARRLAAAWLVVSTVAGALAQVAPARERLPNLDRRQPDPRQVVASTPSQAAAARELSSRVPGARVDFDSILGAPKMITARRGFLTGEGGIGRAVEAATAAALPDDSHRVVKAFLNQYPGLFGHGAAAVETARVAREFTTPHNGLRTINWQQEVDRIDVFEAVLTAHVTKRGELVSLSSQFVPDAVRAANAGMPNRAALQANPPISAEEALARAAQDVGETVAASRIRPVEARAEGAQKKRRFTAPGLVDEAHAKLVWLPMSRSNLRLCWDVLFTGRARGEMFRSLVDAQKGEVLVRRCLTEYISPATYRVYTSDSPSPFSPGHQTPLTNQPPLVARQLVTLSALNTNASPNGWINDGDNETRGNNVDAHLDRNNDNQPDLPRPQGSLNRVFDFPLDLTQAPATYGDAAVVQLFYWNNWVHDRLHELGFTEAAGNFQNDNFGRGGLGNDAVQADAQDGAGLIPPNANNANMATPPDGFAPRMQMYVFTGPNPDRDGDLDGEIVIHEYVHGLSNRRVGGGVGLSALQSTGMGEGWSDFYGLALLSEPGDNPDAAYAVGGYATFNFFGLFQNYYFGIRRYPYSTDLTKNPLTFKDIDPAQASPHTGVPLSPLFSPFSASDASEVHNQGEVWCATLWECRANLIRKYGHTVGSQLILQLVTDGMNLSPANPNMLQARDAILMADQVNNAGANLAELGAGFAKRGMGASARSPASSTTTGVVEAFDLEALRLVGTSFNDQVGGNANGAIDPGELIRETLVMRNSGFAPLTNLTVTLSTATPGVTLLQPTVSLGTLAVGASVTNTAPFIFRIDPGIACATMIDFRVSAAANGRTLTNAFSHIVGTVTVINTTTNRFDAGDTPRPIPDFSTSLSTNVVLLPTTNYVDDVSVSIRLDHTFISDLVLTLVHPDGTPVLLSANNGFNTDFYGTGACSNGIRTTFDDEAFIPITLGSPPYAGSFQPEGTLGDLDGRLLNGNWVMRIEDIFRIDSGTNLCWNLDVVSHERMVTCSPFNPTPQIVAAGSTLAGESFVPANGAIDIGETITVNLAVQNLGGVDTGGVVGTLLPGNGVTAPGGPQFYGVIPAAGGTVARPFTFTATGSSGGSVVARLLLQEGTNILGTLSYTFKLPTTVTNSNPSGIVINDSGAATPYPSTLTIAGIPGVIAKISVNLTKLNHSFPDDVDVLLVSPSGQKVRLMADAGGGLPVTNLFLTFDDAATNALPDETRLDSGTYRPGDFSPADVFAAPAPSGPYSSSLAAFNGVSPNGTWSLYVFDDQGGDMGNIAGGWSVVITTISPFNPPGDVGVTLSASTNLAVIGIPFNYTVTARNAGTTVANGVTVSDVLPAGLVFSGIVTSQGTGTNAGATVTANLGTLLPGAVATATISATPTATGMVTNSVTATASLADSNLVNNSASVVTVVTNPAPRIVPAGTSLTSESFSPANGAIDSGETVTVRLILVNTGTADTTNVVATLLATGGVAAPSGPQSYGALLAGGLGASGAYSFTANGVSNGTVYATLQLQDGVADLGAVVIDFNVGQVATASNPAAIVIPLSGSATPYPSVINVSGVTGLVTHVAVTLSNVNHTFPRDIDALLVGPGGERVLLLSDAGGGVPVSGVTVRFDDSAAGAVPQGTSVASGVFRPTDYAEDADVFPSPAPGGSFASQLAMFNGTSPNGAWSLYIVDDTGGDSGTVAGGWRLDITTVSPINPVTDIALSAAASTNQIGAGTNLTFVITVTNRGPADANNVIVTNPIPAAATVLSAQASQGSVINTGGQLYASLGALSNGAGATFTFVVSPQAGGPLTNVAGVVATEPDFVPGNNTQTLVVEILAPARAVLGSVVVQTNGPFQFIITGQTGLRYVIEGSTDLENWVPIATNFPAGGKITITDTNAVVLPHRFYRARQQP